MSKLLKSPSLKFWRLWKLENNYNTLKSSHVCNILFERNGVSKICTKSPKDLKFALLVIMHSFEDFKANRKHSVQNQKHNFILKVSTEVSNIVCFEHLHQPFRKENTVRFKSYNIVKFKTNIGVYPLSPFIYIAKKTNEMWFWAWAICLTCLKILFNFW